ncbi:MAG TPA: PQQ-dependent sugar dehydrogenase [Saprospiraceae bacterium]|nr:PQQ-dependent sugar dehydrogenase [Saprospiraceae bacterium]
MLHQLLNSILVCAIVTACQPKTADSTQETASASSATLPLHQIKLPPGFKIAIYAQGIENARSMSLSPNGTLFVSTRDAGNVYALQDTNSDFEVDKKYTLISGKKMPNGVAFHEGDLYFAEIDKVWVWDDIESKLAHPGKPELVYDQYPDKEHHGWKYIAFGPDGWLYIPVGGPCNICLSKDDIYASITRLNVETKQREIIAHGVRNTVGFDWHPVTKELWFTDNGGDWLGDDMPACELNYAPKTGMHFGYPFCHQGDFLDPNLGKGKSCSDYIPPAQKLSPHVAPLGMEFYHGSMFPAEYQNQILIAEHGSWNRSKPIGYRVMMVRVEDNTRAVSYESFAEGWLQGDQAWGRPVDLEHLPDGSMLVSDDYANAIYRITYTKD